MTTFIFFAKSILLILLYIFIVYLAMLGIIHCLVKFGGVKKSKAINIVYIPTALMLVIVLYFGKGYKYIPFPFSLEKDRAKIACIENIEQKIVYQFEWTNGWFDDEFSNSKKIRQPLREVNIPPSDKKFIISANTEGYSHQEITSTYLNQQTKKNYYSPSDIHNVVTGKIKNIKYSPPASTYIGDKIKLQNKYGGIF